MTITQIVATVATSLPRSARNDLPLIRQALNDSIDHAVKAGQMTEAQANNWNQEKAVRRVQHLLTVKD